MAIHHNDPGMFIEKLVWQAINFPYFLEYDLRMCTNFEFDFDSMNWTDNNLLVTDNIVAKWEEKIGQFWNTPIEPFIPIQMVAQFRRKINSKDFKLFEITFETTLDNGRYYYKCHDGRDFGFATYSGMNKSFYGHGPPYTKQSKKRTGKLSQFSGYRTGPITLFRLNSSNIEQTEQFVLNGQAEHQTG